MVITTIFTFGLIIGSFLNVCIYRLPRGESIVFPPSHCMSCGTRLRPPDLLPVISWLLLRGRCRYCGAAFSVRYAAVELLTAVLFVLCFTVLGLGPELIKALTLTAFLIVITFIDYDHQLILDKVVIWLAGTGVVINLLINNFNYITNYLGSADNFVVSYTSIPDMLIGLLAGGGLLLLIAIASRGGMGGGDIKFAAALGVWLGWRFTVLALFIAFLLGGVGGVIVLAFKLKGRKDYIPFGPFIAAGALIGLLYGINLIKLYLRWLV